jgi:hypothetical protein
LKLYDEIARIAYDLYEKSGRVDGRELDNWLEAERIVISLHAEQKKLETGLPFSLEKKKSPKKATETEKRTRKIRH